MSSHPRPAYNMPNPNPSATSAPLPPTGNTDELRPPSALKPLPPPLPRGERAAGRLQAPLSSFAVQRSAQLPPHTSIYSSIRSTPTSRPRSNANSRPGSRSASKPSSRSNSPPPGSLKARLQDRIRDRNNPEQPERVADEEKNSIITMDEDDVSFGSGSALRVAPTRGATVTWADSRAEGNNVPSSNSLFPSLPPTNPESALARRRTALNQTGTPKGYSQSPHSRKYVPSVWSRTASMPVSPPNERADVPSGTRTPNIELAPPVKAEEDEAENVVEKDIPQELFPPAFQRNQTQKVFRSNSRLYNHQQNPHPPSDRFVASEGRRVGYRSSISSLRQSRAMLLEAARRTVDDRPFEEQTATQSSARSALEASVRNLERTLQDTGTNDVGGFRRTTYTSNGNPSTFGMSPGSSFTRRPREDIDSNENAIGRWSRPTSVRYATRSERSTDGQSTTSERKKGTIDTKSASSSSNEGLTAAQLWAKRKAELSARNSRSAH